MIHVLGNTYRGPYCTYIQLHEMIYQWIVDGEFTFSGDKSHDKITDLDKFILAVFGFNKMYPNDSVYDQVEKLDKQLKNGTIRLPWLGSQHAPTLWKAMVERHG